MNNRIFKSFSGLTLLTLLMIVFASPEVYSQRNQPRKTETVKVVKTTRAKAKSPARGTKVAALPQKTTVITHQNSKYHYRDGVYYKPQQNNYVVVAPPVGVRVKTLPANLPYLLRGNKRYYLYQGSYYYPVAEGGYEVVDTPVGAITDWLPEGYETVDLDGRVYYRVDETYYKAVLEPNGNVVYEVVRV
ncbi:hypothetical protein FUA23_14325 [Neolewinella aurantiaca]|uniref:Uncharacterized protein n=1 Tax=Neolewinella aurantiaca TaxID=2602767 RepID=A0A5C7FDZ5_9BACT|nr:DUF6515 family protein [Neolewinella aurantiaca]TXF88458.1 hypothetical protein FUA23_14325 [Neolewinella aurantiaca]